MTAKRNPAKVKKNLKKRIFDRDQIVEQLVKQWKPETDEELPGSGRLYCNVCCRHFETVTAMSCHIKSKKHKRQVKEVIKEAANPWDSRKAEEAGGLMSDLPTQSSFVDKNLISNLMWNDIGETPITELA
eukprot:Blabericola_migrator_1__4997@NODE_2598_length_2554_cov_165_538802_g1629_i0_p3_GENE_NODE_2598_length_2554_cov_165_538802_g1629_i0NODE_2598_length_2554_cov_165_538802_g1629_i0_p3_ORF_typecomplete_len130_score19_30zfC2H2_jaz/PF12171_8/0_00026zfC2H2_2/PF12756_7/0_00047zfDBF/PF07535_12/0_01zfC2H2_aberr/PF17017_5/0_012Spt46/PF17734_1/0_033Chalcone/PF02431_15/0_043zfU1/PF06220_12/0_45zfSCNM1/PF15803_5/0_99_NODE_2598_length_2554_cov_165_538802_g1629_i010881477